MANKKKGWTYISLGGMVLSIITLFMPIIQYISASGVYYSYNVIGFITGHNQFVDKVLGEFSSEALGWISYFAAEIIIVVIAVIGVAAIFCAFIGVISMSKQYESVWPFRLSLIGIIGTTIPALSILVVFILSHDFFYGTMKIGAYVVITPLAMIAAYIAVTYRHRLTTEQLALQREASKYIRPAGDL